jgi:Ca2+-binding RTX toxin-like protein
MSQAPPPRRVVPVRRSLAAVGLGLGLMLGFAATSAHAGELSASGDRYFFNAAAGEQNNLVVSLGTDNVGPYIEFKDGDPGSGPAITAGSGLEGRDCEYVESDPNIVRCNAEANTTVNLGDGDDGFGSVGNCGGCDTNDTVDGGPGGDTLVGWAGNDSLNGGPGDDSFDEYIDLPTGFTKGLGADTLNGGDGTDALKFGPRSSGVNLTLDGAANDGAPGEANNIGGDIERIEGTTGADVLVGNDGPNGLYGSSGNDEIYGRGGNDVLWGDVEDDRIYGEAGDDELRGGDNSDFIDGGPGSDYFDGDPPCSTFYCAGGNDQMQARDGVADSVQCGVGADTAVVDQLDAVAADCDTIDSGTVGSGGGGGLVGLVAGLSTPRQRLLAALTRGLRVRVTCSSPCRLGGAFLVDSGLLARAVRVARGSKTLSTAGTATMVLRFTAKAKRQLRKRRRVTGTVRVRATPLGGGTATTHRKRIKLRR